MRARTDFYGKFFTMSLSVLVVTAVIACGDNKKDEQSTSSDSAAVSGNEAAISGTIRLDPALQNKVGKEPLLMIMASTSSEPTKPAVVVKRIADANFPYDYKLTPEDITLVGSSFSGKMYVTARIDSAGMVGPPHSGTLEGTYPGNPVPIGSSKIDIVINRAY